MQHLKTATFNIKLKAVTKNVRGEDWRDYLQRWFISLDAELCTTAFERLKQ